MGEYALYCGLGDRVAVLTYTEKEGKKHLLLEKDLAAYGTSGKSRTRRRWITPEEQKSCRARSNPSLWPAHVSFIVFSFLPACRATRLRNEGAAPVSPLQHFSSA